jgi:hypothetical protein
MSLRGRWGLFVGLVACVVFAVPGAYATPVYGLPADLTGSRSEGSGIVSTGNWLGTGGTISWVITPLPGSLFGYTYTFTNFQRPGISHFILDLTDDCVGVLADPGCVTGFTGPTEFRGFGPEPGNPGFPTGSSIVGVKFDVGLNSYSFVSNRSPVWGDFYIKGGSNSAAYNSGLTNHASADTQDFIARPNGVAAIPEPASLALMGGGLTALGLLARRKRNR